MSDDLMSWSLVGLLMGSQLIPLLQLRATGTSKPEGAWLCRPGALGGVGSFVCSLAYSQSGGFGMVTGHMCLT